ncbi:MAG: anthranilate phosphoribosyltransferase [Actinomycetes bacterium]
MSQNWPDLLRQLIAGHDLAEADARFAMNLIMAGNASSVQIAAFLVALRSKGESVIEVAAAADAMRAAATPLDLPGVLVDVVGTGGDGSHTVNISTMAAVVVAASGAPVIKHGNRAATSASGSADVLEALGLPLELSAAAVTSLVKEIGIGFVFAPTFHPAMRFAGPVRKELGVATVFNILGPLTNPGRPRAGLIGCADERLAPVMAEVFARRGDQVIVVRGDDGWDEITPRCATQVWDTTGGNGRVEHLSIEPEMFGLQGISADLLHGEDALYNAAVMRSVFGLDGDVVRMDVVEAVRQVTIVNAAAALATYQRATGRDVTTQIVDLIRAQMASARQVVESGAAGELLRRWVNRAQALS